MQKNNWLKLGVNGRIKLALNNWKVEEGNSIILIWSIVRRQENGALTAS